MKSNGSRVGKSRKLWKVLGSIKGKSWKVWKVLGSIVEIQTMSRNKLCSLITFQDFPFINPILFMLFKNTFSKNIKRKHMMLLILQLLKRLKRKSDKVLLKHAKRECENVWQNTYNTQFLLKFF